MQIAEALAPDVSVADFFRNSLPGLYATFQADVEDASEVDVIISVFLLDTDDRWTIRHDAGSNTLEIENDEMIDFPQLTVIGRAEHWEVVKENGIPLLEMLEARREELRGEFKITQDFLDDFERYDGVIDVEITDDTGDSVSVSFVLNNYDPEPDYPRFGLSIPLSRLQEVARGDVTPEAAAQSLRISGDKGLAVDLGGLFMTHADKARA